MTKTDGVDVGIAKHIARQHSHGVGVIEEQRTGTDGSHILGKVFQYGDSAKRTEDTADSEGVGNGLTQTVLFGNLKVCDGTRLVETHLNGVDDEIGATERITAIFHTKIFADGGATVVDVFVERRHHSVGFLKTCGINVIKGVLKIRKCLTEEGVTDDIFGKDGASRTHKCDFSHFFARTLSLSFQIFQNTCNCPLNIV